MLNYDQGKKCADQMFVFGTLEDFTAHQMIEVLQAADDLYFNDEDSFLDDHQYDALKQFAHRMSPADVYFTGIGSLVRGSKVKLPHKMGSLDQVYQGDYEKWIKANHLTKAVMVLMHKLDGASGLAVYGKDGKLQISYSRGDGFEGADTTRHISKIHNVPAKIDTGGRVVMIRAENIISPANFAKLKSQVTSRSGRPYKNPRNMVSGLMNSSENKPIVYQNIDFVAYEIIGSDLPKHEQLLQLHEWGFKVAHYETYDAVALDDHVLTTLLNKWRKTAEYEIDGIVIEVDDPVKRARLHNADALNPAYSVKFKVADESNLAIATVREVEWNVSKDGYLKPRVKIHPVELVGVTVQHATGFNAKFILENDIGPGAKIKITRSGDVIPFILETVQPAPGGAQMPPIDADAEWTETGVDLVVSDVLNNMTVKYERLVDFFNSIDIPHLAEGNIRILFDLGFETPESIINLTQEDFCSALQSTSIGKKIFKGMRDKLTNIALYKLMGAHAAFGRGVGERKMKKLYEAFSGDMSQCQFADRVTHVEGFDVKTATKVVKGYPEFQKFLNDVKNYVTIAPYQAKKQGSLTGKTFVFTGFRSGELEEKIVNKGGTMGSGVSSKTSYLVTAEPNSTSGKAQKARDLGVTVIGLEELKKML